MKGLNHKAVTSLNLRDGTRRPLNLHATQTNHVNSICSALRDPSTSFSFLLRIYFQMDGDNPLCFITKHSQDKIPRYVTSPVIYQMNATGHCIIL